MAQNTPPPKLGPPQNPGKINFREGLVAQARTYTSNLPPPRGKFPPPNGPTTTKQDYNPTTSPAPPRPTKTACRCGFFRRRALHAVMAQFDVHRNKGPLKESIPFVVVVQSSLFDRYRRRMVVPLVRRSALPGHAATVGSRMNPVFLVDSTEVVLHPLDMVSVALDQLGEQVASLAGHGQAISDALDELLTRSVGLGCFLRDLCCYEKRSCTCNEYMG